MTKSSRGKGGGPGGNGGLIMGGGPGGGPKGGLGIRGIIIPGGPGSPGAANDGRISGGGGGRGNREIPGGNTSGCKVGTWACMGIPGCGLGGGGGGTIFERSLVPEEFLASDSDSTPSERSLANFNGKPGGGGGGGSIVGACKREREAKS